jgi:rhodanese-related sulfurtransferase
MAAPNEITVSQLLRLIGTPEAPVIVDISIDPDFTDDPYLIPGSFRHPHTDLPELMTRLQGRACVVTCQKGIKLSQGLVAWLRSDGFDAEYLQGGM